MKPTIRNKLVAGSCGVLVLMAAVAAIGTTAVHSLKQGAYDATRVGGQLNAWALEIQVHNLEADRRIKRFLKQLSESAGHEGGYVEEAQFEIHEMQSLVNKAVTIAPTPAMRARFEKISTASKAFQGAVALVVEESRKDAKSGQTKSAIEAYEGAAENLHDSAEDGELAGHDASQASLESIDRISSRSVTSVTAISLIGLGLGILMSYKLTRAILVPVEHLKQVAESVSLGNLSMAVKRFSDDEIGDLADSFSRMVTAVRYFRMEAEQSKADAEDGGIS